MMAFKTILGSVLLVLNLSVSTTNAQAQPKPTVKATTQTITLDDNNKTLTVSPGTTLIVKLTENPSTGYAWHFQNLDAKVFKTLADQNITSSENKALAGAPSTRTITLKVLTKGKHRLVLSYYRSWEKPETATQTFQVAINAGKKKLASKSVN